MLNYKIIAFSCNKLMVFGCLKVKVFNTHEQLCFQAAVEVARRIREKPDLVIALPTGGTPEKMYEYLVEMYKAGQVSYRNVRFFQLDEYLGVSKENPFSYYYYLKKRFFDQADINPDNIFSYDTLSEVPETESIKYERAIRKAGGIDLVVLGIGNNGHIAFNEPGSKENSRTRVIDLDASTISANSRYFSDIREVPRRAITMGIATILEAREIFLLAAGESKADAVFKSVRGPISGRIPASFLRNHPKPVFFIDNMIKRLIF